MNRFALVTAVTVLAIAAASEAATAPRLANRCIVLAANSGAVHAAPGGYRVERGSSTPLFAKPTGLGTFLLLDPEGGLLAIGERNRVERVSEPGPAADWEIAASPDGRVTLRSTASGRMLVADPGTGSLETAERPMRWRVAAAQGCARFPEAAVGATGRTFRGRGRGGRVFGFADAHVHITADMRAGGRVIHGKAFDRFGIATALGGDAADHGPDGVLDVTGNLLRTGVPVGTHDTHGWPTFAGWPTYDTNTHQQVYYVWLRRMWMAGMRLAVAQVVEDEALCRIEPLTSHSCNETQTVKLQVARLRALQDYVDAQSGGRGRGWLRLVSDPRSARRAIQRGKLAVLMGVESSGLFGCSELLGAPRCTRADVDRGIALYRSLGISSVFIAHWVDNAFAGAAFEGGAKGVFIDSFQLTQTGAPFGSESCPESSQGTQCNSRGLTALGRYLVQRLMDNHILIEADHLSEKARLQLLTLAEARHYPLVSSHTGTGGAWTPSTLGRLFALGGFATARPDSPARLAQSILRFRDYRAPGLPLGVGLGTDTGGFSTLPGPDTTPGHAPLAYPFRSYDGRVTFVRERTGTRVFDYNRDGVAHYGLFADLLADAARQPGGRQAMALLFGSAEAYLQMWQRALAVPPASRA